MCLANLINLPREIRAKWGTKQTSQIDKEFIIVSLMDSIKLLQERKQAHKGKRFVNSPLLLTIVLLPERKCTQIEWVHNTLTRLVRMPKLTATKWRESFIQASNVLHSKCTFAAAAATANLNEFQGIQVNKQSTNLYLVAFHSLCLLWTNWLMQSLGFVSFYTRTKQYNIIIGSLD